MASDYRKTRFVCLSDTHNACPKDGAFKLPKGDVLCHAGDLTKQGTSAELQKALDWIDHSDFEVKIVIAGNHDITLDAQFYKEHGLYFHNQYPQDSQACIDLTKAYPSIIFLYHQSAHIQLTNENGPRTSFKVFGSPYSQANGLWAFGYRPEDASKLWDHIPLDVDILITHTPPKYHCDESRKREATGCEALRQTLWRVRPSVAICGHVHEGRGAERVLWDLYNPNIKYKEQATGYWTDPGLGVGNRQQSFLDLSSTGPAPLDNGGYLATKAEGIQFEKAAELPPGIQRQPWTSMESFASTSVSSKSAASTFEGSFDGSPSPALEEDYPAVRGQGGGPPSGRCDMEALNGRMGRRETCIINASIMASSWPYKTEGGLKYNKPIVFDIDLPVWRDPNEI